MQKYTIRHIISTPEEVYIDISRRQTIREDFKGTTYHSNYKNLISNPINAFLKLSTRYSC